MMCCHLLRANHHVTQSLWDLLDGNLQGRKGRVWEWSRIQDRNFAGYEYKFLESSFKVRRIQWASWLDVKSP